MSTPRPHDALFKATMSEPARAADLLRLALPASMFRKLESGSLRVESGSYVDEELHDQHSDLLLSARYAGAAMLIYLLVEHKSQVERGTVLQMLSYMVKVWEDQLAAKPVEPLPPILPILVSHAEDGWTSPLRLGDLFGPALGDHPELIPFVPDFQLLLEDLQDRDDASLRQEALDPGVVMTLLALRDGRRGDILATLRRFMTELKALAQVRDALKLFRQLVHYLTLVAPEFRLHEFHAILVEVSAESEDIMRTIAEKFRSEGWDKGWNQGIDQLRATVRKLLALKFGELSAEQHRQLDDATTAELDRFAERVILCDSIDAVLASTSE